MKDQWDGPSLGNGDPNHKWCTECGAHSRQCCLSGQDYEDQTPPDLYCPGGGDHD